jgi:hypothetical protein
VVVRRGCCAERGATVTVGQEFLSNDMVWVSAAYFGQYRIAIEGASLRARSSLQVMRHTGGVCEAALAEGAAYVRTSVDLAVEMLFIMSVSTDHHFVWSALPF